MPQHPAPESRHARPAIAGQRGGALAAVAEGARRGSARAPRASRGSSRSGGRPEVVHGPLEGDGRGGHPAGAGVVGQRAAGGRRSASTSTTARAPRSRRPAIACGASRSSAAARRWARGRHQALRQQRAAAAAGIDHPHIGAAGAEHAQGRLADPGVEEAREGVGHQHDPRPVARRRPGGAPAPHGHRRRRCPARARPAGRRSARAPGRARRAARSAWAWPARRASSGTPRARWRWASASTLSRAMSTWAGHSDGARLAAEAELERLVQAVVGEPGRRAAPRGRRAGSPRARAWSGARRRGPGSSGTSHPPRERQAPLPLQASPARASPPSAAKLIAVRRGRRGGEAARRSPSSRRLRVGEHARG